MNKDSGNTVIRRRGPKKVRYSLPSRWSVNGPHFDLGNTLSELLLAYNIPTGKVADDSLISVRYLREIRRGECIPNRQIVDLIAGAMDLTPYDHARLLCAAGYIPHMDDPEFSRVISLIAARWLGGRTGIGLTTAAPSGTMQE